MRAREWLKEVRAVTHRMDESPRIAKRGRAVTHKMDESPRIAIRRKSGHSYFYKQ
jgi:hypothetical protein